MLLREVGVDDLAYHMWRSLEPLTADELLTERIFLGLRSTIGVEKSLLSDKMIQKADILCKEKKLLCDATHYHNDNFFLSDELALYILG